MAGAVKVKSAAQDIVAFGQQLHDPVFDGIVDQFDEVAGPTGAKIGDAGAGIGCGRDGLEDFPHGLVCLRGTAGHQRGAETGAFFATGNSQAKIAETLGPQLLIPADECP